MNQEPPLIDTRLEGKLGFDRIRSIIEARCSTDYACDRAATESFSTDRNEIRRRLVLTDEMRLILMFEEGFPTSGYIDCIPFLEPIAKNASIDLLSMGKLRTALETLEKVQGFFRGVKDGVYPNLKRKAAGTQHFPEVQARMDTILDRFGEIKDTASDQLYDIRKQHREKETGLTKRINAILRKAREEGIADSDASVTMRDGRMLIPVSSAKKKLLPGYIHDESASGKTTFIEPAEIVELTGELQEVLCLSALFYLLSHALLFFLQVVITHESLLVVGEFFGILSNDIDHTQLKVLLVQQQVLMLRMHIDQALTQFLEHRQRHRGIVDKRTALTC